MTIPEALQLAVQHHQAGRLAEAEALYRQILAIQPNHAGALHLLGVIAHLAGRDDLAVEWIRRAIFLAPSNPVAHFNLGEVCRALGRLDEAITAFRHALQVKPDLLEAHNNMGIALKDRGRIDEAIAAFRRALQVNPDLPEIHNNLGDALRERGQLDAAIAACRRALELESDFPEAHNNLGNALRDRGQLDEAIAAYHRALELKPDGSKFHNNLGNALRDRGQLDKAVAAFRRALELKPDYPEAQNDLGNALRDRGQLDEAVAAYHRALELKPDDPKIHNNLGNALRDRGQLDEAVAAYRRALELKLDDPKIHNNLGNALTERGQLDEAVAMFRHALQLNPDFPEAQNDLGNALTKRGQLDEAVTAFRHALQLNPDYPEAHNNLGVALKERGQLDEAIASFHHALQIKPNYDSAHSNSVFALHYHPGHDERTISLERRRWNRQFSDPLRQFVLPHANDRKQKRALRIGYVSPDFRDHVVGRNLMPLFACHDRGGFEILCYSGVVQPDALTDKFRQRAQQWRSTVGVSDETLAEVIRGDGVDILVDLAQHTAGNRLPVFARKPAPVQVSFVGYPASTGLEAIEYRISDRYLEAGSADEGTGTTEQVHLIDSFWCYDPCGIEVKINRLPARERGRISFGCLNNFGKVNELVLSLWARVLAKAPESRLLLLTSFGSHRKRTLEFLERKGIEAQRVEFLEYRPRQEYLESYHQMDIVLDTFPYNGHTTSLDALWMGVPVVSLAGNTPVSRAGLSQLSNLGLPELIAHSEEDYVRIAVALARDLPRLEELRSSLRDRMKISVLMDAPRFARQVEEAYCKMWQAWRGEGETPTRQGGSS